ncbi:hypothetical protein [Tabrizicola sp.]|uniref:hypothetical protein n=1 Tax=Tabrizicola sp. TaxID=2005166 RepID=UPI002615C3BB|nr:hypothetical protein [Tabrizicola sp.]MDM7931738.1 hypothetical protein [Tabrizicola sp.]
MAGPVLPLIVLPQQDHPFARVQVNDETVSLMAGLIGIERDLLLGQLFLKDGLVSAEGSHFTHPRHDNFPAIKDGLAKSGAPDLEPLLIALEEAKDRDAVNSAYNGVQGGLLLAKQALKPTEQDITKAVIQTAEAATALLDPSGMTDVVAYQEAWGLLMVARGQLDSLMRSADPTIKQSATKMALAFDDVILFAPDPGASGPVKFDPGLVTSLVETLRGNSGSI